MAAMWATFAWRATELAPDVVHAHDLAMLVPALLSARIVGASVVYDSHELAQSVPYRSAAAGRAVRVLERALIPRCEAVVTVSDGIADALATSYGLSQRPLVVRNLPDQAPPAAPTGRLRRRIGLAADVPLVLHQGTAGPDRGCEALVRSAATLPAVHVAFLGTGEPGYEERLLAIARAAGVEERIHLVENVSLRELLQYTADADVGVSLLEDTCENHRLALPNKVFEYLVAGVPVLVSRLPEMARLVSSLDAGWMVDPGSERKLAAALAQAVDEAPAVRPRAEAAGARLRWSREEQQLTDLYARLAESRSASGAN